MRPPAVFPDAERLAAAAAAIVADTLRPPRPVRLALAGGTTPKRCYALLAAMELSWARTTVLSNTWTDLPPDLRVHMRLDELHVERLRYVHARPYTPREYERAAAWMQAWGLLEEGLHPEKLLASIG